tara:strand:- start:571 stop:789 length:219 start_codon:yes stop_codon:yes gene_type:complete
MKSILTNKTLLREALNGLPLAAINNVLENVQDLISERQNEHSNRLAERQRSEFKKLAAKAGINWEEVEKAFQ